MRLSLPYVVAVVLAAACLSLLTTEAALAACSNPNDTSIESRTDRCIRGQEFSARGRLRADCLKDTPPEQWVYPSEHVCGGNGRGVEAIAHARAITWLNQNQGPGVRSTLQWEVFSTSSHRVDITDESASKVEVYEVKVSDNNRDNPWVQLDDYIPELAAKGVTPPPVPGTSISNLPLRVYFDAFVVAQTSPPCTVLPTDEQGNPVPSGGTKQFHFDAYLSTRIDDGVIWVERVPLRCFDPDKERPPITVPSTVKVPAEFPTQDPTPRHLPMPQGPLQPGPWDPAPGYPMPHPSCCITFPPPIIEPVKPRGGGAHGDPHLITFDGLGYDFMAVGEFQLAKSATLGLDVQMRTAPVQGSETASLADRLAFDLNGYRVEIDGPHDALWVDGRATTLAEGEIRNLGDGAFLIRSGGAYLANWPSTVAERPVLYVHGNDMQLWVPPASDIVGLLGDNDGVRANDLRTASGDQLPATAAAAVIHGPYADSWRISDSDSLFNYADGETTADYTDRSFPTRYATIADLSPELIAEGTSVCLAAGVLDGRQFNDCILDWGTTREQTFVDAAAAQTEPVVEAGAHGLDVAGNLGENFDGDVPANLAATKYATGAGSGRFAGPFGHGGRYGFYVPDVSRGMAVVDLKLITFGTWAALEPNRVEITIDGQSVWNANPAATLTPSSSGMTPSGLAYTVYALQFEVVHTGGPLSVGVSGNVPLASSRAFAVDDVSVHADAVPSQISDVAVPGTVAGNIETIASEDVYAFSTVAQDDAPLLLDFDACANPDALRWELVSKASGRVVTTGGGCENGTVGGLGTGDYHLKVTSAGLGGTYAVAMSYVPVQAFDVSLPAAIDGNLETTASSDVYRFTTAGPGSLRVEFSDCAPALANVEWELVAPAMANAHVARGTGCSSHVVGNVYDGSDDPVRGQYKLIVHRGKAGAYKLSLRTEPAQQFDVSLPASIDGNLESPAASDVYWFTAQADGRLALSVSNCSPALANVKWRVLTDWASAVLASGEGCATSFAGGVLRDSRYRLVIDNPGQPGTYKAQLWIAPAKQETSLSVPATIDGNLETAASEDVYTFSTPTKGGLVLGVSQCAASLGSVAWTLVDADNWRMIGSGTDCYGKSFTDLQAGNYRLSVTRTGFSGTYRLSLLASVPQEFGNVTFPVSIANGVPSAGAGNLETMASSDVYYFTSLSGNLQLDFWDCLGAGNALHYSIHWLDREASPTRGTGCRSHTEPMSPGRFKLVVDAPGATGPYKLRMTFQQAADQFTVAVPSSLPEDALPNLGAGNLETTVSEDVYSFGLWEPAALQFDFSDCSSSLADVDYRVTNDTMTTTYASGRTCSRVSVPILPVGRYQIAVKRPGRTGTYRLALDTAPVVETFDVGLPLTVSNGVPHAGAGNLETMKSTDAYRFSLPSGGRVQVEFSDCAYAPDYELRNAAGASFATGRTCEGVLLPSVPAGDYELLINEGMIGGYKLKAYVAPAPDVFDVSLPLTGAPGPGAGNLETTASEDSYRFAAAGSLLIDVSQCTTPTGYVDWALVNDATGAWVRGWTWACESTTVTNLPAANYRLVVTRNGESGTYRLGVSVPPQTFDVTLPASVSNGVPKSGAGNLETAASEDVYRFSTASVGAVRLDLASCASSLGGAVDYRLTNAATGATVSSGSSCASVSVPDVPAGAYRLSITRAGKTGSYQVKLLVPPPAQVSDVTLPASVTGNMETAASEDVYRFSTVAAGPLQVNVSTCASSLSGSVSWTLVNASSGATVASNAATCAATTVPNVPAGSYRLSVTRSGKTGTYKLALVSVPAQVFDVTLPATVSNGVPKAGAGNLEAAPSEDVYRFSTTSTAGVKLAFSTCASALGTVSWKLLNATTGATVASNASSCATTTVPNVPAGSYKLSVMNNSGKTGTYKVTVSKV